MENKTELKPLENQLVDYLTAASKGVLGSVPFAGSFLAEIAGTVIPNQRLDRMAKFAQVLEKKFENIDRDFLRSKIADENFTGIFEETMRQAVNATTENRREYLANIVANGIKGQNAELIECKRMLKILGELNDLQILFLKYKHCENPPQFRTKHRDVYDMETSLMDLANFTNHQIVLRSYCEQLEMLRLITPSYETNPDGNVTLSEMGMRVRKYHISQLGIILLQFIGLGVSR